MALVPDAECVVVGGPPEGLLETDPYARRLRALAESCGVADRVRLVGAVPREEMGRWYRSADVLVAAPWYEPFGLTPLEAMACGVPVIGTAVGGIRDTVVDGRTGDLVPARDPHALATAIQEAARRPDKRASRTRRRRASGPATRYSWAATAERLVAGLQRGGRRAPADAGWWPDAGRAACWTPTSPDLASALVPYRRCERQLARWGEELARPAGRRGAPAGRRQRRQRRRGPAPRRRAGRQAARRPAAAVRDRAARRDVAR